MRANAAVFGCEAGQEGRIQFFRELHLAVKFSEPFNGFIQAVIFEVQPLVFPETGRVFGKLPASGEMHALMVTELTRALLRIDQWVIR